MPKKNKEEEKGKKNIIGVFDSGLGGLTVLKHFLSRLPDYDYIYLGDNARVPYGEKSPEKIYEYSREAMDFLFRSGCNLVIVACNTASAQALPRLQQEWLPENYPDRKILGVIRPLAEKAAASGKKKIGVIGTRSTVSAGAYGAEIKKIDPKIEVLEKSAPLLVPLIEDGWAKRPETKSILKKYLRPLKAEKAELLILGCTHYPFLLKEIRHICGRRISVPDPGETIAASLEDYLARHQELGLEKSSHPSATFYATDKQSLFQDLGSCFLGRRIEELRLAKLN